MEAEAELSLQGRGWLGVDLGYAMLEEVWVEWKRGGGIHTCWKDWWSFSCSDGVDPEGRWRGWFAM